MGIEQNIKSILNCPNKFYRKWNSSFINRFEWFRHSLELSSDLMHVIFSHSALYFVNIWRRKWAIVKHEEWLLLWVDGKESGNLVKCHIHVTRLSFTCTEHTQLCSHSRGWIKNEENIHENHPYQISIKHFWNVISILSFSSPSFNFYSQFNIYRWTRVCVRLTEIYQVFVFVFFVSSHDNFFWFHMFR